MRPANNFQKLHFAHSKNLVRAAALRNGLFISNKEKKIIINNIISTMYLAKIKFTYRNTNSKINYFNSNIMVYT